jgi:cytoskeletal protein RodZ
MGTLGKYLRDAREARGIDLRDAAQQTRISVQYLRALEAEDFSKLPGAVFVKGFLKNYSKFLQLDEAEVMRRLAELQQPPPPSTSTAGSVPQAAPPPAAEPEPSTSQQIPIEPFIWGAGIIIILVIALFSALPERHPKEIQQPAALSPTGVSTTTVPSVEQPKPEKLYLEVVALEDTWLLVRTDTSPQKKAVLKKGESLIWSADERFLLSYGSAGALRLVLNGKELPVDEPKNAVIRDMTITAAGIMNRKIQTENVRQLRRKQQSAAAESLSKPSPSSEQTSREQKPIPAPLPAIPLPIVPQERQTAPVPKPDPPAPVQAQPEQHSKPQSQP